MHEVLRHDGLGYVALKSGGKGILAVVGAGMSGDGHRRGRGNLRIRVRPQFAQEDLPILVRHGDVADDPVRPHLRDLRQRAGGAVCGVDGRPGAPATPDAVQGRGMRGTGPLPIPPAGELDSKT